MTYGAIAELAKQWVEEAGDLLRESLSNQSIKIEEKTNASDLVTEMDRSIEAFFVEKIREHFPHHKIFGEEGTYDDITDMSGFIWIIDPIDGTLNYVKQKSNFCSMIALFEDGEGVVSFINDVINNDIYMGVKGHGVFRNDDQLKPIPDHSINEGLIAISTKMVTKETAITQELVNDTLGVRLIGSAGLEMIQVLTNRVSAYVTNELNAWDIAQGYMMATELGLSFTTREGKAVNLLTKNPIVVTNPKAHQEIISKFMKE